MNEYIPFIIILTFPIVLVGIYQIIRRNKRLLFILDDKLLKSPIKLSTVLLVVAMFYLLYSYLVHLFFGVDNATDYIWNLVGLLVSASHFVKTKGTPFNYLVLYLFTMLIGLFVYGIFISNLVGYVKERLKKLSKGRTKIIEKQHILIIGKSEYMFPVIDQYIEASIKIKQKRLLNLVFKNKIKNQKIVLLSEQLPEKMMSEVEKRTMALKTKKYTSSMKKVYEKELNKKLIYRAGNTSSIHDLEMCNIVEAATVIVLGTDQEKIKTILAIGATDFKSNEESFVICKFNEREMLDLAERNDLSDEYDLIDINHLISNLTAQTTIQPNLSFIYNDLLDFNKTSIEFIKVNSKPELKGLVGKSFNEVSLALSNVILIGIKNDNIIINPNVEFKMNLQETDSIIIIRDPNATIHVNENTPDIETEIINELPYHFEKNELKFVINGYGKNISRLLTEFNKILDPKSHVYLLFDEKYIKKIDVSKLEKLDINFNLEEKYYDGFDSYEKIINELDRGNDIDSIIILPNSFLSKKEQDNESIFTLQNLKYLEKKNNRDYNITVDLVEVSNQNIIDHMDIADVIISDKFSSELIFQYSTHRDMKAVYDELFSTEGDEIYSIPLKNYITSFEKPINFYTLSQSALMKDQIAIGYKNSNEVVILTADKSKMIQFSDKDHLVVISKGHS